MKDRDVLREVDDVARAQAQGLLRGARSAALAVAEPGSGHPLASRVSLACDVAGAPMFLISRLSAHFGALEADGRCSVLCGEAGRGDPLAHPRITVIGRARIVAGEARAALRERFLRYHPKAALYADFGDFAFWRVSVERASLNAGFGKAYALEAGDLIPEMPEGLADLEPEAVAHMTADHQAAVDAMAGEAGWRLAGLDARGLDLARGDDLRRVPLDPPLSRARDLRPRLIQLAVRPAANPLIAPSRAARIAPRARKGAARCSNPSFPSREHFSFQQSSGRLSASCCGS